MVYLITGPVNSGKSTRLLNIYKIMNSGDGFYNVPKFNGNKRIGQDIVRFADGKAEPFCRVDGFVPYGWNEGDRYKNHSFSKEGLYFARKIIEDSLPYKTPLFIDELGPLELAGGGLRGAFRQALIAKKDIYAVSRGSCVKGVIKTFGIREYVLWCQ